MLTTYCMITLRSFSMPLRGTEAAVLAVLAVLLGEIRVYGWEIRGEISQHLAAHMHTRPSWETQPQTHEWRT